jgi:hypothetical protein
LNRQSQQNRHLIGGSDRWYASTALIFKTARGGVPFFFAFEWRVVPHSPSLSGRSPTWFRFRPHFFGSVQPVDKICCVIVRNDCQQPTPNPDTPTRLNSVLDL